MSHESNASNSTVTEASHRAPQQPQRRLPDGWQCHISSSKNLPYYYNAKIGYSMWESPPELVSARHLLVKHNKSRNPTNHKGEHITRSKAEAIEILKKYQETISSQPTLGEKERMLAELAKEHSDCRSAEKGGHLGYFPPASMQPEFARATLDTKPQELSGIVETASGVHLIIRLNPEPSRGRT